MGSYKKDVNRRLKIEIEMHEKGGHDPSARQRRSAPEIFRDSIICLNLAPEGEEKEQPCSSCFLSKFAPPKVRYSNDNVCHEIPLSVKGDTLASLSAGDNPYNLRATVRS